MSNTFDTVDYKLAETEFFLKKMSEVDFDPFTFNCYLSAFISAARTTTLALQRFKHVSGFGEWYEPHRTQLAASTLASYFHAIRNDHMHGGPYPVASGSIKSGIVEYCFGPPPEDSRTDAPATDVVTACREYLVLLLEIVLDCYEHLGPHIDPQQHYTKENVRVLGKTIDDAELELFGWVCSSLVEEGFDDDDRWHEIRAHVGECQINHLFHAYLGKTTPQPKLPERLTDFEATEEEKGWVHIPAGFSSIEDYFYCPKLSTLIYAQWW